MITKKDLKAIDEHNKNAIKLHLPTMPVMFVNLKVSTLDGKIVSDYSQRCRSWTRNGYNDLAANMMGFDSNEGGVAFGAGAMPLKDTGGTTRQGAYPLAILYNATNSSLEGLVGTALGIVVGTGVGAEDFEGNALGTIVAHGNGAGQMSYTAQTATALSYVAGTKKLTSTLVRVLNNNSGGAIVVAETGIYKTVYDSTGAGRYIMVCRDLLGATVSVADTAQLTVTYTIDLTYPA